MTDAPNPIDPNPAGGAPIAAAVEPAPVSVPLTDTSAPAAAATPPVPAVEAPAVEVATAPAIETKEAAPAEPAKPGETVADVPSLLEGAGEKKPADPAQPGEKPAEQPVQPQLATTYQAFEMPEGLVAAPEKMEAYTGVLGKYGISQEAGQELVNLHADAMKNFAEETLRNQHKAFNETRSKWANEVRADPELGGAGHQTAMTAVARMRDLFVAEKDLPAFNEFLRVTGAGDHPQFLKLLHNAARHFDEPPLPPPNPRPPKDIGKAPSSRMRDLYNNSAG